MGKKQLLADTVYKTGGCRIIALLRTLLPRSLRILAYHRICETDELNDRELVSASPGEFDWQVRHVKKHYSAMTFEEVIRRVRNGSKLPRNAVVITFDDGFEDNYSNAFPILKKHGIPATFFISTAYIDSGNTFWFNGLSRMLMSSPGRSFGLNGRTYSISENSDARRELVEAMLWECKQVDDEVRHQYLESISMQLGYADECDPLALPLTWRQVTEMSDNGMEFGSHSATHPILARTPTAQLKFEIHDSRRLIEEKLGKEVPTISYPDGGDDAISPEVLQAVRDAGYLLATSYVAGTNYHVASGNILLKRIHVERYVDRPYFASMLALPELLS